jgi:hypothetical protein
MTIIHIIHVFQTFGNCRGREKEPAHLSIKEEDGLLVGLAYYYYYYLGKKDIVFRFIIEQSSFKGLWLPR